MAEKLKRPVYLIGQHHYCEFLKEWSSFTIPLNVASKLIGYLAVFILGEPASKELIALTELLGYKIIAEIKDKEGQYANDNVCKLNCKQRTVLQYLASGKTEKAVAIEMKLNIGTIKYHKLNAFKKLGANCTIEAIIKALKSNQIYLENIDV